MNTQEIQKSAQIIQDEKNAGWIVEKNSYGLFEIQYNRGEYKLSQHFMRQIDSPGASGVTANYGTGTKTYGDLNFSFGRSFFTGQEGICYVGNTGGTIDRVTSLTITDCFSYNSQREGIQVEHVANVRVSNCTCILTGQEKAQEIADKLNQNK